MAGTGLKITLALILALAVAGIIGFILADSQGGAVNNLLKSGSEFDSAAEDTTSGLKDKLDQSIQEGIESGGIDSGGDESAGSGGSVGGSDVKGAIGGGPEYVAELRRQGKQTYCQPPQGATTVSSAGQIPGAIEGASNGDVVYIQPGEYDLSDEEITVPGGVTVAGNRGCNGAPGPLLIKDNANDGNLFTSGGPNIHITGLRLEGYVHVSDQMAGRDSGSTNAIRIEHDGGEVSNNEIYDFVQMAVRTSAEAHVHHNYLHHCNQKGLGYCVEIIENHALIEYNHMNHYRHAVKGYQNDEPSYELRYNVIGPDRGNHCIDLHGSGSSCGQWCGGDAGRQFNIHHNTVKGVEKYNGYHSQPNVDIRGVPAEESYVRNNWFWQPEDEAVMQEDEAGRSSYDNVVVEGNHYGESTPPSCDIGAGARDGCRTSTSTGGTSGSSTGSTGGTTSGTTGIQ